MATQVNSFAGLSLGRSRIMGIINVTPDSFSDGGDAYRPDDAIRLGKSMVDAGADILDIGGESTRPGSKEIFKDEELRRIIPVIEGLLPTGVLVSIDTRHADVMRVAIDAGAHLINDVTALDGDPKSLDAAAQLGCPVVLMHMQGEPGSMQEAPAYRDAPAEISDYLAERIAACERAGIHRSKIAIDPGIGFGKTVDHNLQILNKIDMLHDHGCAVVLGVSRKSFIGAVASIPEPKNRMPGSIASAVYARTKGVQIFRVHDVDETRQALSVCDHIQNVYEEGE